MKKSRVFQLFVLVSIFLFALFFVVGDLSQAQSRGKEKPETPPGKDKNKIGDSIGEESLVKGSLACGDIDGDDMDEIIVSANVDWTDTNQSYILAYDYSPDSISGLERIFLEVFWGPKEFVRGKGRPDIFTVSIPDPEANGFESPFILHVQNGNVSALASGNTIRAELDPVSIATVTLNGEELFGPSDFSQQVSALQKGISIKGPSELTIALASKPGSGLVIWIEGQCVIPDGTVKWRYSFGPRHSSFNSSPAIGADGTVYFGSHDGNLHAVNPDGTGKWVAQIGSGRINGAPAIGEDGMIFVGLGRDFVGLDPHGTVRWKFSHGGFPSWFSSAAIGDDGTLYVGAYDWYFYALDPVSGAVDWRRYIAGYQISSPAIDEDGNVFVGGGSAGGNDAQHVHAFTGEGGNWWPWGFFTGNDVISSPALGADGTLYIGSYARKIFAISTAYPTAKWEFRTEDIVWASPVIGLDGTVYVGDLAGHFYAINPTDGSERWRFTTSGQIFSTAAVGADGTVYFGCGDRNVYALNPDDGSVKWSYQTGNHLNSSPAIGTDGTLYITSMDGGLYAFHTSSGGLADTPWPKFRHDSRNTGNVHK